MSAKPPDNLPDALSGCWEKLSWATDHIKQITDESKSWIEDKQVDVVLTEYRTGVVAAAAYFAKPPPRFGVLVGNVLHNLRSTLDYLVWQLVILNGNSPKAGGSGNTFPIYDKPMPKSWLVGGPPGINGVKPQHKAFIEAVQPYKVSPEDLSRNVLWRLRELSDADKHQLLHVTNVHGHSDGQIALDVRARGCQILEEHYPPFDARFYDGTVFAVLEVEDDPRGPEVVLEVKARFPVLLTIEYSTKVLPVVGSLVAIRDEVVKIVDAFLPVFKGGDDPIVPNMPKSRLIVRRSMWRRLERRAEGAVVVQLRRQLCLPHESGRTSCDHEVTLSRHD